MPVLHDPPFLRPRGAMLPVVYEPICSIGPCARSFMVLGKYFENWLIVQDQIVIPRKVLLDPERQQVIHQILT